MPFEIIIEEFGSGNAVVVRNDREIIDFFIDPPKNKTSFFPPKTFMWAKIERRIRRNGGYFIKLPNGNNGFLVSKRNYAEGSLVKVMSQIFYEIGKPQKFTDRLKIITEYFIIDDGFGDILYSKKLKNRIYKNEFQKTIENKKINVIFRSSLDSIDASKLDKKFENAVNDYCLMTEALRNKKIYYGGLAKKIVFDKYDQDKCKVIEGKGIFETLGIWDQLTKTLSEKVLFGAGSYIYLEHTRSFCTVDVNSGSDFKSSPEEINLVACEKIFLLITQRGLGGKIIIDFLPSSKEIRDKILFSLMSFFSKDTQRNSVLGWTRSGSFEIERERDKTPFHILLDY